MYSGLDTVFAVSFMSPDAQNLAAALQDALPENHLDMLRRASERCARAAVELYVVGGTVRDILIGHPTKDLDIDLVIVGADESFQDVLASEMGRVVSRSEFMTVKIAFAGIDVDLVRARAESYSRPGALPEVRPGSLHDDLVRRDFAINAMAVSLNPGTWGDLIDPTDGQTDLSERSVVRVLHDRSFENDPTRIFRAVRYAGRLEFAIDPETHRLLSDGLRYVDALSGDRVRHEIECIFAEQHALDILRLAREVGALEAVHPELGGDSQALDRLQSLALQSVPGRDAVLLGALTWPASRAGRLGIRDRLRLGTEWSRVVLEIDDLHDSAGDLTPDDTPASRIRGALGGFHAGSVEAYALLSEDTAFREVARLYLDRLRHIRPVLTGDDLIALGVPEGPEIGRLLDELRDARLDGVVSTREDEVRWVRDRSG